MSDPSQVVHQERPYYIILTGPYEYLFDYLSDFQENFKDAHEGEDYFLSVYYPESGVEKVKVQEIKTPGNPEYICLLYTSWTRKTPCACTRQTCP